MAGVASIAAALLLADLLSPGPLAKAHADLEGIKNCTKCHEAGEQVSDKKCLDCHKELQPQLAKGTGFHGHIPPAQRTCNSCHHEHQGRDFALIEWDKKKFDHARTGVALKGKHAPLDCAKCHDARRVQDPAVKALKRETFLGQPTACSACHFDEHRGQEGLDCAKCHNEQSWKPAPGFVHAKTEFALRGAHQKVECLKCHAQEKDAKAPGFPPPVHEAFSRFKPVAHARCTDCHKDPHDGKLGADCERCHVEESWATMKTATGERAFHEKTRFPLRGAHAQVGCKECHGPWPGRKAIFKNMKFQACLDCHEDAHEGQLKQAACERCHDVISFKPARFEAKDHAQTKYPLLGAHLAVGCAQCHPQDKRLEARAPKKASFFLFHPDSARCESCHQDPHKGQLKKACAACHEVSSFHAVKLDHDKETRFALAGAHRKVACASCHFADAGGVTRYTPLPMTCAACHPDPHAGQFGVPSDCARCHQADDFRKTLFVHAEPYTKYALTGKHRDVACEKCHAAAQVAPGRKAARYRGTPTACESCHADFHKGAFAGFEP
ncbi:MAG: cytochrome c3 family protein [Myxococcales bacterium]